MLMKKKCWIILVSMIFAMPAYAENFYAKVGMVGTLSMKPDILTQYESKVLPAAYIGFGMDIADSYRVGIIANGWLDKTKIATGPVGDIVFQNASYSMNIVGSYIHQINNMFSLCASVKAGYANGVLGIGEVKLDALKPMESVYKNLFKMDPFTFGGDIGVSMALTESICVDCFYSMDYYKIMADDKISKITNLFKDKKKSAVMTDSAKIIASKISLGLTFKL